MANELHAAYDTGYVLYGLLFNSTNAVWSVAGTALVAFDEDDWADYAITYTESGDSGLYFANFPALTTADDYYTIVYERLGATPDSSDDKADTQEIAWDGSAPISIAGLGTVWTASVAVTVREDTINLEARRGNTERYTFTVVDSAGDPVNLTGFTAWFTAKYDRRDADADAVISKTTSSGISFTDAANGIGQVTLSPTDTSSLPDTVRLEYELQLKDGSGNIYTPASGQLTVLADVPRATS